MAIIELNLKLMTDQTTVKKSMVIPPATVNVENSYFNFKLVLLIRIMGISALLALLFPVLHYSGINYIGQIQPNVDIVFSILTLFLIVILKQNSSFLSLILNIFFILCFITCFSALLTVPEDDFRAIWFYLLVILAFIFRGKKFGYNLMILSISAMTFGQFFIHEKFGDEAFITSISGIIMMSLILSAFVQQMIRVRQQLIKQSKELHYLANKDPLTDALNSQINYQLGKTLLIEAKSKNDNLSMLCINIDHFRRVNKSFGQQKGDLVLKHVVQIIKAELHQDEVLAQINGQEFCILLPKRDMLSAENLARRISQSVQRNLFTINDKKIPLTLSIGISSLIDSDIEIRSLQVRADKALLKVKSHNGNDILSFDDELS
ncbi:MAG: GGDEF domain-containing protein [Alteromonadaceae bacterium]|nr:GGDEF domain-containing protein [Alteromonadaceae bacterium]